MKKFTMRIKNESLKINGITVMKDLNKNCHSACKELEVNKSLVDPIDGFKSTADFYCELYKSELVGRIQKDYCFRVNKCLLDNII